MVCRLAASGTSPAIKEEPERNYPLEGKLKIHRESSSQLVCGREGGIRCWPSAGLSASRKCRLAGERGVAPASRQRFASLQLTAPAARCAAKLNVKATSCRVHVDGGKYVGIPRTDGSFVVHDVPAGTREPQLHQSPALPLGCASRRLTVPPRSMLQTSWK